VRVPQNEPIHLSGPDITEAEIQAVVDVLRTRNLSLGPRLAAFEQAFYERLGVRHAVACSSGTAALHLIWRAMGIGPGDEVITTPFSFIASSNSILFTGARPVFVDIDPDTWQIDANRIEQAITPRTKAILPVDVFGSIPEMDAILEIAGRHGLRVLEDSCEALGATYQGRPAGALADAGCFGFYPNKQITTGEGGMITTNHDQIASACRSLRNQGRDPNSAGRDARATRWLQHARLGYNYRLSDINCAIGVVQMRRLDDLLARRAQVAAWYRQRLADEKRVRFQRVPAEVRISWFVMVVRLDDRYGQDERNRILAALNERGVSCSNYFTPIHLQPFYREQFGFQPGDLPVTEALSVRTVALPFHNGLSEADVDRVCREFWGLL
jgi:perosamine synthetase